MSKEEQFITVAAEDDGQRLDRWLKKNIAALPWGLAQRLIRKGAIRVDQRKSKTDARLAEGQVIRLPAFENRSGQKKPKFNPTESDKAFIRDIVIYDDGNVLALNKPGDIAVQGGGGVERHIDGILPELADKKGRRPRLIHRLDRETSGVLLCARSPQAVSRLGKAFHDRKAQKTYWALVTPAPEQRSGTIKAPLAKGTGPARDRMYVSETEDAKMAVTDYEVLDQAGGKLALVAFYPRTGRTHQIRVHAADVLGCPIVGDDKYGGAQADISGLDLSEGGLYLHARRLVVRHPLKDEVLDLAAPLPPVVEKNLKMLGFDLAAADAACMEGAACRIDGGFNG